jgi:gas vesicle protein
MTFLKGVLVGAVVGAMVGACVGLLVAGMCACADRVDRELGE